MSMRFRQLAPSVHRSASAATVLHDACACRVLRRAQDYPSGPVQIIVAFGAGGGTDTLARLLAPALSKILGRPVTVQNLPGGGGQVAATAVHA